MVRLTAFQIQPSSIVQFVKVPLESDYLDEKASGALDRLLLGGVVDLRFTLGFYPLIIFRLTQAGVALINGNGKLDWSKSGPIMR